MEFKVISNYEVNDMVDIGEKRTGAPNLVWTFGKIVSARVIVDRKVEYLIERPSLERSWYPEHLIIGIHNELFENI